MTRVVHCKREPYDVYAGRPSKWGNPFHLKFESERDKVVAQHREWLRGQPKLLADLHELKDKTIGCFCFPRLCHADNYAEILDSYKVIVAGSRDLSGVELINSAVVASCFRVDIVVSGTARGIDQSGEEWASNNDKEILKFPANWAAEGNSAGYKRNERMALIGDALVAVWDGRSRGTRHMIAEMERLKKPVSVWKP